MITGNDLIRYNQMVDELSEANQLVKYYELQAECLEDEICRLEYELYVANAKLAQRVAGLMGD